MKARKIFLLVDENGQPTTPTLCPCPCPFASVPVPFPVVVTQPFGASIVDLAALLSSDLLGHLTTSFVGLHRILESYH